MGNEIKRERKRDGGREEIRQQARKEGKKQKSTIPLVLCHQIERNWSYIAYGKVHTNKKQLMKMHDYFFHGE